MRCSFHSIASVTLEQSRRGRLSQLRAVRPATVRSSSSVQLRALIQHQGGQPPAQRVRTAVPATSSLKLEARTCSACRRCTSFRIVSACMPDIWCSVHTQYPSCPAARAVCIVPVIIAAGRDPQTWKEDAMFLTTEWRRECHGIRRRCTSFRSASSPHFL